MTRRSPHAHSYFRGMQAVIMCKSLGGFAYCRESVWELRAVFDLVLVRGFRLRMSHVALKTAELPYDIIDTLIHVGKL